MRVAYAGSQGLGYDRCKLRARARERERERVREEREGGKEVGRMGEGKGKREFICALALRHDVCFPLN